MHHPAGPLIGCLPNSLDLAGHQRQEPAINPCTLVNPRRRVDAEADGMCVANLQPTFSIFMAFYKWVWRTREPVGGRDRLPAAMLAGVTDRLWTFGDLFDAVTAA